MCYVWHEQKAIAKFDRENELSCCSFARVILFFAYQQLNGYKTWKIFHFEWTAEIQFKCAIPDDLTLSMIFFKVPRKYTETFLAVVVNDSILIC